VPGAILIARPKTKFAETADSLRHEPPTTVSVVICCYAAERRADLERALASMRAQASPPLETIVVVDDNPALAEALRADLADAVVVENEQRPGLAGARNTGAARASGDVVAFLDDDAEADSGWVDELRRGYRSPGALGVGGEIAAVWPTARPGWFPREFDWVVGCSYSGMATTGIRNLIGANMSMRAEVLRETGGFDDTFGRLEETEFCVRASRRFPDGSWVYRAPASVRHHVSPQRTTWRYFRRRCFQEGIAKARMVQLTGREAGLSSERAYLTRVLPGGMLRGLRAGLRGDPFGPVRAAAIAVGATATAAGFLRERFALRTAGADAAAGIARRGANP
jgi:GT2 family glycosyltransferase